MRVNSVSVRSGDTNRLESFSYTDGLLTVYFSEATRGSVRIAVDGTIPLAQRDVVRLPAIRLPNIEILESFLLLSADSGVTAYIADLAGASPDTPLEVGTTAVDATPLRLTITDESRPLALYCPENETLTATAVVVPAGTPSSGRVDLLLLFNQVVPRTLKFPADAESETLAEPLMVDQAGVYVGRLSESENAFEFRSSEQNGAETMKGDWSAILFPGISASFGSSTTTVSVPQCSTPINIAAAFVVEQTGSQQRVVDEYDTAELPRSEWTGLVSRTMDAMKRTGVDGDISFGADALYSADVDSDDLTIRYQRNVPASSGNQTRTAAHRVDVWASSRIVINQDGSVVAETRAILQSEDASGGVRIHIPGWCSVQSVSLDGQVADFTLNKDGDVELEINHSFSRVSLKWSAAITKPTIVNGTVAFTVPEFIGVTQSHVLAVTEDARLHWSPEREMQRSQAVVQMHAMFDQASAAGNPDEDRDVAGIQAFLQHSGLESQAVSQTYHDVTIDNSVTGSVYRRLYVRELVSIAAMCLVAVSWFWEQSRKHHDSVRAIQLELAEAETVTSSPSEEDGDGRPAGAELVTRSDDSNTV